MTPKRYFLLIVFAILPITLLAQDDRSIQGAVGAVTIDGKVWNQVALRPVVPIWKFGVALDLVFYIDGEGNIRKDNWDFSSGQAIKNTLIDKIYYIRYGKPDDPLYLKIGALDYVDLGYGILVNGYTNTTDYPQIRRVGLDMSVKTKAVRLEGFVNDFKENASLFGARGVTRKFSGLPIGISVVVDRNQYLGLKDRDDDGLPDAVDDFPNNDEWKIDTDGDGLADSDPLDTDRDGDGYVDVDDINAIHSWWDELGENVGFDFSNQSYYDSIPDGDILLREPLLDIHEDSNPIAAVAIDIGYPILTDGKFKLSIYAQMAKMLGETIDPEHPDQLVPLGSGLIPLGLSAGFGPLRLNMEYRMIPGDGRFDFNYWNRSYDLERVAVVVGDSSVYIRTKEQSLGQFGPQNGVFGQLTVAAGNLLSIGARYQNLKGSQWDEDQNAFITDYNQSLLGQVRLTKSISKLSRAELFYEQRNVDNPFKFELTESTIMGYVLGMDMGGGMTLLYRFTRTFKDTNGDGVIKGKDETANFITFETAFAF